jgi:hypothetical protein
VDTHDDGTVVRAMLPAVAEQPLPEQAPVPILMRRAALPD